MRLGVDYFYLLSGVAIWPLVAAFLSRLLGAAHNYVRYMIVYNWMAVPTLTLAVAPHLLHLATGAVLPALIMAQAIVIVLLYVSWYVAKAGLATTAPVAFAFLLAILPSPMGSMRCCGEWKPLRDWSLPGLGPRRARPDQ